MKDDRGPRQVWFKFFPQRYLIGGSIRAETLPDERAVWLDFLCLANAGYGHFYVSSRDALATQLLIPRALLDRAIEKFTSTRRVTIKYDRKERKEIFSIVKWPYYQDGPPKKSPPPSPPLKEEIIEQKERKKEDPQKTASQFSQKDQKSDADFLTLPEIPDHFSFEEKKILRDQKAEIRRLERLTSDPIKRQYAGLTEKELKNAVEKARKRYVQTIEDRT